MSATPVDECVVARLEALEAGLFRELAALFVQGYPADIARLREALAVGDHPEAAKAAHKIKGASATVGAVRASEAAARFEAVAQEGDTSAATQASDHLEEALEDARSALGDRFPAQ